MKDLQWFLLKEEWQELVGKYENDYAIKYDLNQAGQIISQKEYLSDILLATQLYGQEVCGDKKLLN